MKLELAPEKLRALPVQVTDLPRGGAVIKRGRVEIRLHGDQAGDAVRAVLETARPGASLEEIVAGFAPPERPSVEALVQHLMARRILVMESDLSPGALESESQLDVFYWHFGAPAHEIAQRFTRVRYRILGVNVISRQLATSLRAAGAEDVEVLDHPWLRNPELFDDDGVLAAGAWPGGLGKPSPVGDRGSLDPGSLDCLVATSDLGDTQPLREWNELCLLHNIPFLPVLLQDLVGYVGPIVVPGETACYECLRSRQNSHLPDPVAHRTAEDASGRAVAGFLPAMASILGDVACVELTKFFGLKPLSRIGTLLEVNLLGGEMTPRRVLRLPRCPVCSTLTLTPSAPFTRAMLFPGGRG
jgi:bacteriocin biosynthesis cyclodehydratase domain-containing protein